MARKSLLTESEIRRFMKLASMQPLGVPRLGQLQEQDEVRQPALRPATDQPRAQSGLPLTIILL